nr:tRNA dimethylallyltransferase 2 isoform X2 [Tanacetum cinerariifolium]
MASGSAASTSVPYVESTFAGAKRKSKDIGWEYGVISDPKNPDRIKCTLCEKLVWGVTRLKRHSAQITGQTTSCSEATKEDQLKFFREGKGKKVELSNAIRKERMWMTKKYIARWAYEFAIPFHAFEKDSFKLLLEVVGQFGPGLPPLTRYELSTPLLKEELIDDITSRNHLPVIVGGTNYYIQALVSRFLLDDSLKDTDESCFGENYGDEQPDTQILPEQENFCYTYDSLKVIDPVAANRIHPNDHRKLTWGGRVFDSDVRSLTGVHP